MMQIDTRDELVFLPLGGSGEIGMNFNAYGFGPPNDRQWIIVDCGVLFGREASTPGVDLIMPDIRYLAERRENVLGIVATHAHEDHIGAIAPLWPMLRCPVYATPFTAGLIEGKLEEAGCAARSRCKEVPVGGKLTLGPFTLDFISITHSILEPNLLAIRTPLGVVAHTGDWKLDPDPLLGEETDEAAHRRSWATKACWRWSAIPPMRSIRAVPAPKRRCATILIKLVGTLKGRVAVTAFASNVARLDSVARAAKTHGRRIALVGRSMHKMVDAARDTGYLNDFPADAGRGRSRRTAAAQGAVSVHRQPGRAARRAGPHRRGQSSRCPAGQGRRGDLFLPHHSRQRTADLRAAEQAGGAGHRGADRDRIITSMSPAIRRATNSPDVSLDPAAASPFRCMARCAT